MFISVDLRREYNRKLWLVDAQVGQTSIWCDTIIRINRNMKKTKVMLHYSQYGVQRSPNDQQDLLRASLLLQEKYEFITLDQPDLPGKDGHIKSIKELYKQIKETKPDIVHIIGVKEGFHCMIATFLARCPKRIVITRGFAGLTPKLSPIRRFVFRWFIEPLILVLSTYVHCNSYFSYNQQMVRLFAKQKRMVVYNFLNFRPFCHEHIWRNSVGLGDDCFIVATVGNMHAGKGYDLLQKVINHFHDNNDIKFVTMGSGVLKETFEKENADNNNVFVLGAVPHEQVIQIMSESNVFYLPTRFESLGMVYAEAGACGIPAIGTDVGAVNEIIEDGKTGYLLKIEDYKTAILKIEELYNNREKCMMMGKTAQKKIFSMFSSDNVAKDIMDLYSK